MTEPAATVLYYRVKANSNGTPGKFSALVAVRIKVKNRFSLSPNPANTFVTVNIYSEKAGQATIRFLDMTGRLVYAKPQLLASGANSIRIEEVTNLAGGLYTVQIVEGQDSYNERLIIKK